MGNPEGNSGLPDTNQAKGVIPLRVTLTLKVIIAFAVMIAVKLRMKVR